MSYADSMTPAPDLIADMDLKAVVTRAPGQSVEWTRAPRGGFTTVEVLQQLRGRPLDDFAVALVSSLRPSYVRVVPFNSTTKSDARCWRVTIDLGPTGLIETATQEVQVDLPARASWTNGYDLTVAAHRCGIDLDGADHRRKMYNLAKA